MEQFLEMAEWQQCTAVLYECAVAADSRRDFFWTFMSLLCFSMATLLSWAIKKQWKLKAGRLSELWSIFLMRLFQGILFTIITTAVGTALSTLTAVILCCINCCKADKARRQNVIQKECYEQFCFTMMCDLQSLLSSFVQLKPN